MKQPNLIPKTTHQTAPQTRETQLEIPQMNDFTSFEDILNIDSSEVERPKPLPQGSYIGLVVGLPIYDKSSRKQTPFVQFTIRPVQALDDVDQGDLAAMGGLGTRTLPLTFYIPNKDNLWRLEDFLDNCGLEKGNMKLRCEATQNCQIGIGVKHDPQDDGVVYARINKTFSL